MGRRSVPIVIISGCVLVSWFLAGTSLSHTGTMTYKRSVESYNVPRVTLVNQDGEKLHLEALLQSEKPVIVNFIFTTCTTICPVLAVGFANFQQQLGPEAKDVQLVSISIDPDNDRPEVMKPYLQKFGAQPGWEFLTGSRDDIIAVMKAFDSYVMNKMDHHPLTLLKAPGAQEWVRVYGLVSTSVLMQEYRTLLAK
jgi:protein SCO1/2